MVVSSTRFNAPSTLGAFWDTWEENAGAHGANATAGPRTGGGRLERQLDAEGAVTARRSLPHLFALPQHAQPHRAKVAAAFRGEA